MLYITINEIQMRYNKCLITFGMHTTYRYLIFLRIKLLLQILIQLGNLCCFRLLSPLYIKFNEVTMNYNCCGLYAWHDYSLPTNFHGKWKPRQLIISQQIET